MMMKISILVTFLVTSSLGNIVKRQDIVFPNDDDDGESGIENRYARPHYNYPSGNRYHYGFNRHFNRRPQWNQNQQQQSSFRPTQHIPQFSSQNQIYGGENSRPNQNLQFGGSQQNQNFVRPQNIQRPAMSTTLTPQQIQGEK
jgi:hypothetical protein